ncbi:fused MFS/spermidine synthase [Streptomyces sp. T-3]|nr:fused MFS/spermidine synthase [Streptomyces sp. T-3]
MMVTQQIPEQLTPVRSRPAPVTTLPHWAAALLVAGATAAVLLLEVLASRLVAPYVGINLQVNSAVIGIALAAIALGAWGGGRLADRHNPASLLGGLLVAGGVATLLVLPLIRWAGKALNGTSPLAIILLASLAIFIPALLLSTVSPLVVKLQLRDLKRTGQVVGRLSAIGTIGGILATFLTGFVLVAALPSSTILLITGSLLVVSGVITELTVRRRGSLLVTASVVLAVAGAGLTVTAPRTCHAETAYNCIQVNALPDNPSVKVLKLSTSEHSYVDLDDPTKLHMGYVQALASATDSLEPGRAIDAFHIGGGGMTLPMYLDKTRPGGDQLVYEIDPGLVKVSKEQLGFREHEQLKAVAGDGRTGLQKQPDDAYDLVVEDAFGAHSPPWHLTTREVVQDAERTLREGGYYLVNLIDFPPGDFARSAVATVQDVFPHVALLSFEQILNGSTGGNVLVVASDRPIPVDEIRANLKKHDTTGQLIAAEESRTARFTRGAQPLRDDFAPVDQLVTVPMKYW